MRKIRVLDNVYDLITINMEDRFKDHVAFRFYNTANDAVTTKMCIRDRASSLPSGIWAKWERSRQRRIDPP